VVWIDYAKANQPPGSFKMGPRDSRPFSQAHMEICDDDYFNFVQNGDDDSDAAYSDKEEESPAERAAPAPREAPNHGAQKDGLNDPNSLTPRKTSLILQGGGGAATVPLKRLVRAGELAEQKALALSARDSSKPRTGSGVSERSDSPATKLQSARQMQENALLRTMIQEEIVPGHGSIYIRSIAPGPGYYGTPGVSTLSDTGVGQFGHRPRGRIDTIMDAAKQKPGPGDHTPRPRQLETIPHLGRIGRAPRLVPPTEVARKLPFISALASACEGYGTQSPPILHAIAPDAPCAQSYDKPAKYSFGRMKRPF